MSQDITWPAITVPAAVGGATAVNQTNGTQKAQQVDAAGNVQPAGDIAARALKVDGSAVTQPVSGPLTDAQLRAAVVPVSLSSTTITGTVTTTGTLTDTQLRAVAVPVSGPLTDAQLRAAVVPVSLTSTTITGTVAVSGPLTDTQLRATAVPVSQASVVSTANSSTTALASNALFTGTSEDISNFSSIQISVFSDVASAALGLSIQQSINGTNWDFTDAYTVPAAGGKVYSVQAAAKFFRIVYTNGATVQASFRLQTIYHLNYTKASTHSLADTITLQNDAELHISQMRATNGANSVPLIADASGNLGTNTATINSVAVLMGAGPTGTGAQRVTAANIAAATLANVAGSATSVTLLASGAARMGATFFNDSTAVLYLKFSATASTTSYTVQIASLGYYELPQPCYSGIIDGIWASANGNCRVTSW